MSSLFSLDLRQGQQPEEKGLWNTTLPHKGRTLKRANSDRLLRKQQELCPEGSCRKVLEDFCGVDLDG